MYVCIHSPSVNDNGSNSTNTDLFLFMAISLFIFSIKLESLKSNVVNHVNDVF